MSGRFEDTVIILMSCNGLKQGYYETAKAFIEKGAKVLIVERRAEIGVPVLCGEGISQRIDNWEILEGTRWIANKIEGARIYAPDGTMVKLSADIAGNETGYVIYRDIFDQELARCAIRAGAKIMMKTEVTSLLREKGKIIGVKARQLNDEVEIEADIVVGADGDKQNIMDYIAKGIIQKATVAQNSKEMGKICADIAVQYLKGEKTKFPAHSYAPVTLVTQKNADEFAKKQGWTK